MRYSEAEHQRLARYYRLRKYGIAYLFLSPNLLFFILFIIIPFFFAFYLTFNTGGLITPLEYVGLKNWSRIIQDKIAILSVFNTFKYMAMAIPIILTLGMILALLLQRITRMGGAIRAMIYFPTLAPMIVASLVWIFVVHRDFGIFNILLHAFGFEPVNWLGNSATALPTIVVMETWRASGYWALYFLAALLALPTELYQAAKIDGAGPMRRFRYLTLPLLRPTLVFAIIMITIWHIQLFDSVFVLTDGGPNYATATIVWYIYKNTFQFSHPAYGATMSFFLLIITLLLALVEIRLIRRRRS